MLVQLCDTGPQAGWHTRNVLPHGSGVQKSEMKLGWFPPRAGRENLTRCFFFASRWPSPCSRVPVSTFPLSLRTWSYWITTHSNDLTKSIISVKNLSFNEVTFSGAGGWKLQHILGGTGTDYLIHKTPLVVVFTNICTEGDVVYRQH